MIVFHAVRRAFHLEGHHGGGLHIFQRSRRELTVDRCCSKNLSANVVMMSLVWQRPFGTSQSFFIPRWFTSGSMVSNFDPQGCNHFMGLVMKCHIYNTDKQITVYLPVLLGFTDNCGGFIIRDHQCSKISQDLKLTLFSLYYKFIIK